MKIAIALLAFVALAAAAAVEEIRPFASTSDKFKETIEEIRDQMPCGFPSKNIPSLAPLVLNHRDFHFESSNYNISGALDYFTLNGLNDFTVDEMNISKLSRKATFAFTFKNIDVDTQYKLDGYLNKAGVSAVLKGEGPLRFAVSDLVMKGAAKFSYNILSQKLKLKSFDLRIKIGAVESAIEGIMGEDAITEDMNRLVERVVVQGINSNEETIAKKIEEMVVPKINEYLADKKLSDLSGNVESAVEKVPCNPEK